MNGDLPMFSQILVTDALPFGIVGAQHSFHCQSGLLAVSIPDHLCPAWHGIFWWTVSKISTMPRQALSDEYTARVRATSIPKHTAGEKNFNLYTLNFQLVLYRWHNH